MSAIGDPERNKGKEGNKVKDFSTNEANMFIYIFIFVFQRARQMALTLCYRLQIAVHMKYAPPKRVINFDDIGSIKYDFGLELGDFPFLIISLIKLFRESW